MQVKFSNIYISLFFIHYQTCNVNQIHKDKYFYTTEPVMQNRKENIFTNENIQYITICLSPIYLLTEWCVWTAISLRWITYSIKSYRLSELPVCTIMGRARLRHPSEMSRTVTKLSDTFCHRSRSSQLKSSSARRYESSWVPRPVAGCGARSCWL